MITYVSKIGNKYFISQHRVIENQDVSYLKPIAFYDILCIADVLNDCDSSATNKHFEVSKNLRLIEIAKQYNCEIGMVSDDEEYTFPVFISEDDAIAFNNAINAKLLLSELKNG